MMLKINKLKVSIFEPFIRPNIPLLLIYQGP